MAGAVLQAGVFHIPRHDACVTIRATLSIAMGVVVGDGHKRFTVVPVGVPGFGSWPAGTMTTVPLASIVGPGGYNDAGRRLPPVGATILDQGYQQRFYWRATPQEYKT